MQHITHLNFAKGFRGGERQTLILIKELSKKGYTQTILTRQNSELANRLKDVKNLTIIKIKKPYIFSLLKIKNTDILHAHETKAAQFAYFAHLVFKTPYIITRRVDKKIKNNPFNQKIYKQANCIIALSTAIKKGLHEINPNLNIQIIPSAISKLPTDIKQIKQIKSRFKDKFLIGNIGELNNHDKGQIYLLEAMKKLSKTYPQIHLILLGKGKDELLYKEMSKDLPITFEGFVDNVGDYIASLDLFVFPSLSEGLGSILLDVMSFKIPIIASDVGGIPDVIQERQNGLLIPAKNTKAIYEAIVTLYLDKELQEKIKNQAYKDVQNYTPSKMTDRYIKAYKGTL